MSAAEAVSDEPLLRTRKATFAESVVSAEPRASEEQSSLDRGGTLSMHELMATDLLETNEQVTESIQQEEAAAPAGPSEKAEASPADSQQADGPARSRSGMDGLRMGDPGFERAASREPDFYLRMLGAKRAAASGWSTEGEHLEQLSKQNDTLEKEIRLFMQYLAKNRHTSPTEESPAEGQDSEGSLLSLDERCEIVSAEVEAAEAVVSQARREGEAKAAEVRMQLRQLDDDILQAERDAFDFRRIFVRAPGAGPLSSSTKKQHAPAVSGEKLMSFLDSVTKAKAAAVEKLAFKTSIAKDQGRKLEVQLEQHTLGGVVVGAVDYEKLRIENQQQAEILKRRNEELPRLRLSAGRATQALRSHQVALKTVLADVGGLQQTLQQSQSQSATLEANTTLMCSASTAPAGGRLSDASGRRSSEPRNARHVASLPILDYVKLTKENQELTAKLSEMESKYETAMSLTQKVKSTLPKAEKFTASARSASRSGLRA